jgi:hypothetical protein
LKPEKKDKGEHKEEDTKRRKEQEVGVLYWNVPGLNKRGEEFWDCVR